MTSQSITTGKPELQIANAIDPHGKMWEDAGFRSPVLPILETERVRDTPR